MHIALEIYIEDRFEGKYGFSYHFMLNNVLKKLSLDDETVYRIVLVTRDYYPGIRNKPDYYKTTSKFADIDKLRTLMKQLNEKCTWSGGYILYLNKISLDNMILIKIVYPDKQRKYIYLPVNRKITRNINQKYLIDKIVDSSNNKVEYQEGLTTSNNKKFSIPNPVDNFYSVYYKMNPDTEKSNNIKESLSNTSNNAENPNKVKESLSNNSNDTEKSNSVDLKINPDIEKSNSVKESLSNISDDVETAKESSSLLSKTKKNIFSGLFNFSSRRKKLHIN